MKRIAIVGTSGSGKTTLGRQIAELLGAPNVELDALHWGPNWTPLDPGAFRDLCQQALSGDSWVADGNYRAVRDIVWRRADTLVWIDDALPRIVWRLVLRTLRRAVTREELWYGNHENLRQLFFSRGSLFLWAIQTHSKRRREYTALLGCPEYGHLDVVRLRSLSDVRRWLSALTLAVSMRERRQHHD